MSKNVLTHTLLEPLGSVTKADVTIDPGDGNLEVDGFTSNGRNLASGMLQYLEKNGPPTWSVDKGDGQTNFTIKAAKKGQPWVRLPWAACNGATNWQIHLNRQIPSAISAQSNGGNIKLDLNGMPVTRVSATTGGGNIEVILSDPTTDLIVTAESGAGNVVVHVPGSVAAKIRATTGLGKLILSSRFINIEKDCYQSLDFDQADRKIEMTISSGLGNVVVDERAA